MNKTLYCIASVAMVLAGTSCGGSDTSGQKQKKNGTGIDFANLDTTARPGEDFYEYACGGWMKSHTMPGDHSRYGTFDVLDEMTREQLKSLIAEIASKPQTEGTIPFKIARIYNAMMDSTRQNELGIEPLKADLASIDALKDKGEIVKLLPKLQSEDVDCYFTFYVDADPKNSEENLLQTYQSGLGLGEKDYYVNKDTNTTNILDKYKQHVEAMFLACGFGKDQAREALDAVMRIENRLAKSHYSKEKQRDPLANYHKMSFDQLKKDYKGMDWDSYFEGFGLKDLNSVSVSQPEPVKEAIAIMNEESLQSQKYYLSWCVINTAATSLGDSLYNRNFEFYGKVLSGKKEPSARWKRAVSLVNGSLGEAVGQMYVEKYFPKENKQRMLALVENLRTALGGRIKSLEWMSDSTKERALDKLNAFKVKIGYPDKWRDYGALDVSAGNLWELRKSVARFNTGYQLSKVNKPVDRSEWHMTPQTVNAYYNPTTNDICFPAGILQYPFFDMQADDAFNYGAIGVVIGHEMTHGFDDQGRQFDKYGNLEDWWTEDDARHFKAQAKVLADFFNKIEVAPGVHANGDFTLGENLADHGGLMISFQAYKAATEGKELPAVNGFSADQRFFLAYAGVWASLITKEEILRRTKVDPHALGRWRVNGALPQVQAWYDAFNIGPESGMYVKPENRVKIW